MLVHLSIARSAYKSPTKQLHQFNEVVQCSHPPRCDVDVTQYTASLLECDNWSTFFGVLLNKLLYCVFPDPFLPRVAVTVSKESGYARLAGGAEIHVMICLLYFCNKVRDDFRENFDDDRGGFGGRAREKSSILDMKM